MIQDDEFVHVQGVDDVEAAQELGVEEGASSERTPAEGTHTHTHTHIHTQRITHDIYIYIYIYIYIVYLYV